METKGEMKKYHNDNHKPAAKKHISFEEAITNAIRYFKQLDNSVDGDVALIKAVDFHRRALLIENMTQGSDRPSDHVMCLFARETQTAILRGDVFKAANAKERGMREIEFRLKVLEEVCRRRNLDPDARND